MDAGMEQKLSKLPHQESSSGDAESRRVLVLTGDSSQRRHVVYLAGQSIRWSTAPFITMLELAASLYVSRSGFLRPETFGGDTDNLKLNIHRLRAGINEKLGARSGFRYVTTGTGVSYRLEIPLNQIYLDDSLFELPPYVVPATLMNILREMSTYVQSI